MVFPVVMYGCEMWTIKKAECQRIDALTVVLENTLEGPLDCKEIKTVNSKGNQSWTFIGRTDAKAEAPILQPADAKSQLIRKDPGAGKDWRQEEKGTTKDEMVGWHHRFVGHELEQALGDGEGQGSLTCGNGVTKIQTWLSDWTRTTVKTVLNYIYIIGLCSDMG